MCLFPVHFIASFLWAPPVATQFSVVRAPPVATLVISIYTIALCISAGTASGNTVTRAHSYTFHLISTQHFYLGTACVDAVFCSVIE